MERVSPEVNQILPESKTVPLEGLYLGHHLLEAAKKAGRPLVISNYVTDKNDVIARNESTGAPQELENDSDWRLFQELTAQADAIITGPNYLKRFKTQGQAAQNVLTQFDPDAEFAELGDWRLKNGYAKRNPDVVVVSRSLDFEIPAGIFNQERKIFVFTSYPMSKSEKAMAFREAGAEVVGAGQTGVNGGEMIDYLGKKGYRVIKNTTGPRVLEILLSAGVLDRLYITQVQIELSGLEVGQAIKVLGGGQSLTDLQKAGFRVSEEYLQKEVITKSGQKVAQRFLVLDKVK